MKPDYWQFFFSSKAAQKKRTRARQRTRQITAASRLHRGQDNAREANNSGFAASPQPQRSHLFTPAWFRRQDQGSSSALGSHVVQAAGPRHRSSQQLAHVLSTFGGMADTMSRWRAPKLSVPKGFVLPLYLRERLSKEIERLHYEPTADSGAVDSTNSSLKQAGSLTMHDAAGEDIVLPAFYWANDGSYHDTTAGMAVEDVVFEDQIFQSCELDDYLALAWRNKKMLVLNVDALFTARPKHGNCSVLRMAGSLLGHPLNPAHRKIPWYQSGQNNLLVLVPHEHMQRFDRLQEALGPPVVQRLSFSWMEPAKGDWGQKQATALQKKYIEGRQLGAAALKHYLEVMRIPPGSQFVVCSPPCLFDIDSPPLSGSQLVRRRACLILIPLLATNSSMEVTSPSPARIRWVPAYQNPRPTGKGHS